MRFDFKSFEFIEVEKNTDKLAAACSDGDLTWGELKKEIDDLKNKLEKIKIPAGHPVVIYGHKEKLFVITMIACMEMGLPYIPVDTIYPEERLYKIKEIVKSELLVDCRTNSLICDEKGFSANYWIEEDPICYIIFTSGSTGEPKGVQITRKAVASLLDWMNKDFDFGTQDIFMNQVPFSFDVSVFELMGSMYFGSTFILNSRDILESPDDFLKRIKKYRCSIWVSTPSFVARILLSENFNDEFLPDLKTFLLAGETLQHKIVKALLSSFDNSRVLNSYGPTEATVTTTLVDITQEILEKYKVIPIGYPKYSSEITLANIEKDESGKEIGEIEITGEHVMIGYFNRDDLSAEKLSIRNGRRCFNTGDFGYFQDDMLFFIGRKDHQVKLHGFRIEIDEIDATIERCSSVIESITVPLYRKEQVARLISFIKLKNPNNQKMEILDIKTEIAKYLPHYMVPSDIIALDQFPYNNSSKIDKKSLVESYKQGVY
ncbi:MAG: AMP-binding protein [Alphaproteobacteria bacterium]